MKKLVVAAALVFLLLSCGSEPSDPLFKGDNPLIGTWDSGSGYRQIVFIDDTTTYFTSPRYPDAVNENFGVIYNYTYEPFSVSAYEDPLLRVIIQEAGYNGSNIEFIYYPKFHTGEEHVLCDGRNGAQYRKIKR